MINFLIKVLLLMRVLLSLRKRVISFSTEMCKINYYWRVLQCGMTLFVLTGSVAFAQETTVVTQPAGEPTTPTTVITTQPEGALPVATPSTTVVTTQPAPLATPTTTVVTAPPTVPASPTTTIVTTPPTGPASPSTTIVTTPPTAEIPTATTVVTSPETQAPVIVNQPTPASLGQFEQWLQSNNTQAVIVPNFAPPMHKNLVRSGRPLTYEQAQKRLRNSVPTSSIPQNPDAGIAFNRMMRQNMPLSPQQVIQLHQEIDLSQRAAAVPPTIPPKPVSSTLMVNLAPGTTPPAIRLAQGYVSALMFVDSTGAPWPIASFDIGNPKAVNIQWDGKSNIILIQAVSPYNNGDIVVRLFGLPTPITMELVTGQRVVDYRVDIHVSGIGPNTKEIPVGTILPNPANQLLLGVLDGVAPAGSRLLNVRGADAQAWLLGDTMFFRTRLTLLSPGWIGKMVSPDGMNAYELPRTSSVLVSRYGEPVELKIEGF